MRQVFGGHARADVGPLQLTVAPESAGRATQGCFKCPRERLVRLELVIQRDIEDPVRKYRGIARFPADLTFNLGLRADTNVGGFSFAFSNVFGFLPVLRGER